MPLFNNVCGLSLTVACKILAVIHLIGSIIYIGMGASVLAADDVTKSHQIAYSITIACTVLNVLNSFLLYFGVDKGKDHGTFTRARTGTWTVPGPKGRGRNSDRG